MAREAEPPRNELRASTGRAARGRDARGALAAATGASMVEERAVADMVRIKERNNRITS